MGKIEVFSGGFPVNFYKIWSFGGNLYKLRKKWYTKLYLNARNIRPRDRIPAEKAVPVSAAVKRMERGGT